MNFITKLGFTLIELMVSVSIVSLIMVTVLWNYGTFNDNLALTSAGQELAIGVRKSQTYGLSVKEVSVGSGQFDLAYGIYFSATDPTNYYIFVDKNSNNLYDVNSGCGSSSTECVEKMTFRNGIKISQICGASCPIPEVSGIQVTFKRPNPDAKINFSNSSGASVGGALIGKVILISPKGKTETVTVQSTGQISVQ
ncbi:MAG: type II secretion system protein [Candidatus Zambryskibacteria bacterium]|nr:type II secretion system protein [Candidatus Zambryskibacteria bacterium]